MNACKVTIHDVAPLALTLLVDFAYTGELVVSEDNVQVGSDRKDIADYFSKIRKKLDLSFVPRSRLAFIVLCDIHLNPGPPSSILSSAAPICQRGQNHCDQNY